MPLLKSIQKEFYKLKINIVLRKPSKGIYLNCNWFDIFLSVNDIILTHVRWRVPMRRKKPIINFIQYFPCCKYFVPDSIASAWTWSSTSTFFIKTRLYIRQFMKIRSGFANGSWYFVDVSDNRKKLFVSKQIVMLQQTKHETCLLNSTFYMLEFRINQPFQ